MGCLDFKTSGSKSGSLISGIDLIFVCFPISPRHIGPVQTALKKPGDASHEHVRIRSMVGFADSGVGKVKPAPLGGKGDVLPKKIMGAEAALRIKLKRAAEIRMADIGQGEPRAASQKGHPPRSRRDVIPKQRGKPRHVACARMELHAAKRFADCLQVAFKEMVSADDVGEHPTGID
jgi:hypothetical protein